jgi:hypothetical protein
VNDEASYVGDSGVAKIVIPLDLTAGASQKYVEGGPVCCHPNVVRVEINEDGDLRLWAEGE